MKNYSLDKDLNIQANIVARKFGYGKSTQIIVQSIAKGRVIKHVSFGHRKYTTGEYVSNAYLANFGWKNTYYQNAETLIALPHWQGGEH